MFELKKIGIVRRASAWLLDAILLSVLATGFMWIVSLICNYSAQERLAAQYNAEWEGFRKEYLGEVAEYYGFTYREEGESYTLEKDGQAATLDDVMKALIASNGEDGETARAYEAYHALPPPEKVNAQYQYVYTMLFMTVSVGVLLAYLALEFVVPLILKNGQTVGKKVFGIGLCRSDCVKIAGLSLFARTFLGKYAIETMFPVLLVFLFFFGGLGIVAVILLAALLLLNTILFFATKNRTPIHDILAYTVAVDIRLQMIYESEEALNEQKALLQREAAQSGEEQPRS